MASLGPYMAHIWEWYGKVEWCMELIWDLILANFMLWEMYGKKSRCSSLYGSPMGMHTPQVSHGTDIFVCSIICMGIVWEIFLSLSHRLSIQADLYFFISIGFPYHHLIWEYYGEKLSKIVFQAVSIMISLQKFCFHSLSLS